MGSDNRNNKQHSQDIIFHSLRAVRWMPLLLFVGIGAADTLLQLQRAQEVHWLFLLICAIAAVLLFQLGNILCHQTLLFRRLTNSPAILDNG